MINTIILHERLQDSENGGRNTINFLEDLEYMLIDSLNFVIDKKSDELTNTQKLALAVIAGCELEMDCFLVEDNQYAFQIKTKNKIGVRKIDDRFQVIESK